jgi:hypothetical protein
MEDLTEI